jgi:chaperone modulatory protein CbpM
MATQSLEIGWLDDRQAVTVAELGRACSMSAEELQELVDYGVLVPLREAAAEVRFSAAWVMPLRRAARLRSDFDLDLYAVSLLLRCMERIEALESELHSLRARQPAS